MPIQSERNSFPVKSTTLSSEELSSAELSSEDTFDSLKPLKATLENLQEVPNLP